MKNLKKMLALLLSVLLLLGCAAPAFAEEATEPEKPAKAEIDPKDLPLIDIKTGIAVTRYLYSTLMSQPDFSDYLQSLMKYFAQETLEKGAFALIVEPIVLGVLSAPSWSFFVIVPLFAFFPRFSYRTFGEVVDLSSFHSIVDEVPA